MKITDYTGGWLVGDFTPNIVHNKDVEVAIKKYKKGDSEPRHVHYKAKEYTLIIIGKVKMNDVEYSTDDIIIVEPNTSTDFHCLEDTITCVVKTPSVPQDKFLI